MRHMRRICVTRDSERVNHLTLVRGWLFKGVIFRTVKCMRLNARVNYFGLDIVPRVRISYQRNGR